MWRLPLSDLNYDHRETDAVRLVLESQWLTMGPKVAEFESGFARVHGADFAVAVGNCTAALELIYRYALVKAGAERNCVVVPDITFVASANAVLTAGGVPVLCDIDSGRVPFLSPDALRALLEKWDDIGAVCLVHYAGMDAGARSIAGICAEYGVALIEDCAHAAGASNRDGNGLGTSGLAGCFSFFSNKNLSTGEGGMVTTNDEDLANWLRLARSHGVTSSTWSRHKTATGGYDVVMPGTNCRMTEMTAALGLVQLDKLADGNRRRMELSLAYDNKLSGASGLQVLLPPEDERSNAAYHLLSLMCRDADQRDGIRQALTEAAIQTSHHYSPLHTYDWYAANNASASGQFPHSTAFAAAQITLPLHPKLSEGAVDEICEIVLRAAEF